MVDNKEKIIQVLTFDLFEKHAAGPVKAEDQSGEKRDTDIVIKEIMKLKCISSQYPDRRTSSKDRSNCQIFKFKTRRKPWVKQKVRSLVTLV